MVGFELVGAVVKPSQTTLSPELHDHDQAPAGRRIERYIGLVIRVRITAPSLLAIDPAPSRPCLLDNDFTRPSGWRNWVALGLRTRSTDGASGHAVSFAGHTHRVSAEGQRKVGGRSDECQFQFHGQLP